MIWEGLPDLAGKRQGGKRQEGFEASISHRFLSVIKVSDFGERRQEVASFCLLCISLEKDKEDEAMYVLAALLFQKL